MAPFMVGHVDVPMRDSPRPQGPPATPKTVELPAGHRRRSDCRALPSPIILDQDQVLTLRDGTKIRADIYRPKTEGKVPAILMWGPYGKSGSGPLNINVMPMRAGIPAEKLSGYEDFEGLDPAEWVPKGYAIVNADPRGVAIAPFEGASDVFREQSNRGGIPYTIFGDMIANALVGRGQQEDIVAVTRSTTAFTEYHEDKRADFSKVQVPAYIVASYSNELHVVGTMRAFEEIPHKNKWLSVHSTHEWYDLYTKERTDELAKFYDYYLKGVQNDWLQTPPARLPFFSFTKPPTFKAFSDLPWHEESAVKRQLHLTTEGKLSVEPPSQSGSIAYAASTDEKVAFTYTFPSKTTITGPTTVVIDISSPEHTDLDVYTHLFKADKGGNVVNHLNIPTLIQGLTPEKAQQFTTNAFARYWVPMDSCLSGRTWKTLSHAKVQPVNPGEIVQLEIQLWPTGLQFDAGEQLILKISGEKIGLATLPNLVKEANPNKGKHVLHLGGKHGSCLEYFTLDL
ncbi:Alpha/Beta hydrolase protein [Aspergillus carlsbadensis]|nr:Alpha/Beta hydrolase protein [Aspergillus carlsbadensis]